MNDDVKFWLGLLATGMAIVVVVMGGVYWFSAQSCDAQWFEFEHRFGFYEGCMVQYEGTWYPDEVVRTVIGR